MPNDETDRAVNAAELLAAQRETNALLRELVGLMRNRKRARAKTAATVARRAAKRVRRIDDRLAEQVRERVRRHLKDGT